MASPGSNNKGIVHENGSKEGPHGHLKREIEDTLVMRRSRDFEDLAAYRRFIDEIVGRFNARNARRIDAERAHLTPLPARRTTDHEEVTMRVTSSASHPDCRATYQLLTTDDNLMIPNVIQHLGTASQRSLCSPPPRAPEPLHFDWNVRFR